MKRFSSYRNIRSPQNKTGALLFLTQVIVRLCVPLAAFPIAHAPHTHAMPNLIPCREIARAGEAGNFVVLSVKTISTQVAHLHSCVCVGGALGTMNAIGLVPRGAVVPNCELLR